MGKRSAAGFSLPEMLVVLAVLGIGVAIMFPLVGEQIRQAQVRTAADQLAVDLKAARMIAISTRAPRSVTIEVDPDNRYEYTDGRGVLRRIELPGSVRIVSSPSTVTFRIDGSIAAAASTVLEVALTADVTERWTLDTNVLGVTRTTRQRIS